MKCEACGHEGEDFFAIRTENSDARWLPIVIYRGKHESETFSYEAYQGWLYMCPQCRTVKVGGINGFDDPEIGGAKQADRYKIIHLAGLEAHGPGTIERATRTLNQATDKGWRIAGLIGDCAIMERQGI